MPNSIENSQLNNTTVAAQPEKKIRRVSRRAVLKPDNDMVDSFTSAKKKRGLFAK